MADNLNLLMTVSADVKQLVNAMNNAKKAANDTGKAVEKSFNGAGPAADKAAQQISRSMQQIDRQTQQVTRNLSFQLNDITQGLLSGTSPFTIMAQQTSQITQAFDGLDKGVSKFRAIGSALSGMLSIQTVVTAAVIYGIGTLVQYFTSAESGAEDASKALKEHQDEIRAIGDRWKDTLPGVKAYTDALLQTADAAQKMADRQKLVTEAFAPVLEIAETLQVKIEDLQDAYADLGIDSIKTGQDLRDTYEAWRKEVEAGRSGAVQIQALQKALDAAVASGVPAVNELANKILHDLRPALAKATEDVKLLNASFGEMPRSLAGAGGPGAGLGVAMRAAETERFNESMGDAADAIDGFVERVIGAEGGKAGGPNKAGASTAFGQGQFIDSTWKSVFKAHFAEEYASIGDAGMEALRNDLEMNRRMIRAYAQDNAKALLDAGQTVSEASLQLAHFLGPGGAISVLKAAPGTKISAIPGMERAINANPTILGGGATREDVMAYASHRADAPERKREEKKALDEWMVSQKEAIELKKQENLIDRDSTATVNQKNAAKEEEKLFQDGLNAAIAQYGTVSAAQREAIRATAHEMAQLGLSAGEAKTAQDAFTKSSEDNRKAQEAYAQAVTGIAKTAVSGFVNDLRNGVEAGDAFRNMLDRVIDGMINMAIESLFAKNALGGVFSALGGGGGLSFFPAAPTMKGGGRVGFSNHMSGKRYSPALWANAPSMAGGGIVGDPNAVPIIAHRGEIVVPTTARRGGGAAASQQITTSLGDVNIDMSQTGAVAANNDDAKQFGLNVQRLVQAEMVRESRPGGLLRRVPG